MTQARIDEFGNLNIIFNEIDDDDVVLVAKVDNGAEIEYIDDTIYKVVLPNFEQQLNRGSLLGLEIDITNIYMEDDILLFELKIVNDFINCKVDLSSIDSKI